MSQSIAMAESAPDWMMLDRFVYRRDDKEAFPDKFSAPLRARSFTSLGKMFQIAFLPANPPGISRFYVRWPGGTKPQEGKGTELVAAHRNLVLLRLTSIEYLEESPYLSYTQDHFLCIASSDPEPHLQLKRLPLCRSQVTIPPHKEGGKETVLPHVFFSNTVGLLGQFRKGGGEEFFVAQLAKVSPISNRMMEAEVCVLRSRLSSDDGDGKWDVEKIRIQHEDSEYGDLRYWSTDDVVTFKSFICWVDYHRGGILFYDTLKKRPTILYLKLGINNRPKSSTRCQSLPEMKRRLCYHSGALRFVEVVRSDECIFGPFELGSGFTIKSYTLSSLESVWVEDVNITSEDLWASNTFPSLPHEMLMFPLVNMENFNIIYFLTSQYVEEKGANEVSVITVDMGKNKVLGVMPYITGKEDVDMVNEKSHLLRGFMSSTFPLFLRLTRGLPIHLPPPEVVLAPQALDPEVVLHLKALDPEALDWDFDATVGEEDEEELGWTRVVSPESRPSGPSPGFVRAAEIHGTATRP